MRRTTIGDIAKACGVSPTAVSFALNGRPGISEATRAKILATAAELGWRRSAAATALSQARAGAIGLVIANRFSDIREDSFFLQLIAGIERGLASEPTALVLKMVESTADEVDVLQRWWSEQRVDGVILVNPKVDDPRLDLLVDLPLPAVFIGEPAREGAWGAVGPSDADLMCSLLDTFAAQGVRSIDYLLQDDGYVHNNSRRQVAQQARADGLAVQVHDTWGPDLSAEVRALVSGRSAAEQPDLYLCNSDRLAMMVVAGLTDVGLSIPSDVKLASFEDSAVFTLNQPQITALTRDPMDFGTAAVEQLRGLIAGGDPTLRRIDPPRLVERESTLG